MFLSPCHRCHTNCHRSVHLPSWEHNASAQIDDLEAVVAGSLCERFRAKLQPDGSILLVPEDYNTAMDTRLNIKLEALRS